VYDRELTIQAVEDVFERYRYFKNVEFEEIEAKVTASYEIRDGGHSGGISDSTANIAGNVTALFCFSAPILL
jgi:hypothetical protein